MTRCPACGAKIERRQSWSGNPRLSWGRCPECGRMELEVDKSLPPKCVLEYSEYDFAKLMERARCGKNSE